MKTGPIWDFATGSGVASKENGKIAPSANGNAKDFINNTVASPERRKELAKELKAANILPKDFTL